MFAISNENGRTSIVDNGIPVLMLNWHDVQTQEIDLLFLRQPQVDLTPASTVFHLATVIGMRLHCLFRMGRVDWGEHSTITPECDADQVRFGWRRRSRDGVTEETYDMVLAREGMGYRVHGTARLIAEMDTSVEFVNLYPAGLANPWPGDRRFDNTIHEVAPGQFRRRPHSPLTIINHLQSKLPVPEGEVAGRWPGPHHRCPLCTGGRLFWTGEEVTPAFRLLSSSVPVYVTCCDMWRDEHVCLSGGVLRDDGRYEYRGEFEVGAMPQSERDDLAAKATLWGIGPIPQNQQFPQFRLDGPNRFTEPVATENDHGAPGFFFTMDTPDGLTYWDTNGGPEGTGAVVLNTSASEKPGFGQKYQSVDFDLSAQEPWIHMRPMGPSIHLYPGQKLSVSCDVRAEDGVQAWVEIREARWANFFGRTSESRLTAATQRVNGNAWRTIRGELTARDPSSGTMVLLCAAGAGKAHFSNLHVERIG